MHRSWTLAVFESESQQYEPDQSTCCLTRLPASAVGAFSFMAALIIEPGPPGKSWVSLPYSEEGVARIKRIPGRQWHPERKQWLLSGCPETRAALAELIALPSSAPEQRLSVAPKRTRVVGVLPGRENRLPNGQSRAPLGHGLRLRASCQPGLFG